MKTVVLQYNGLFIAGFSFKTQKVFKTANPDEAKRFTAIEAMNFIAEHTVKNRRLHVENIRIHILKRGMPFMPFKKEEGDESKNY